MTTPNQYDTNPDFNTKRFKKSRGRLVNVPLTGDAVFVPKGMGSIAAGFYFEEVGQYRYFKKWEDARFYLIETCFLDPLLANAKLRRMEAVANQKDAFEYVCEYC